MVTFTAETGNAALVTERSKKTQLIKFKDILITETWCQMTETHAPSGQGYECLHRRDFPEAPETFSGTSAASRPSSPPQWSEHSPALLSVFTVSSGLSLYRCVEHVTVSDNRLSSWFCTCAGPLTSSGATLASGVFELYSHMLGCSLYARLSLSVSRCFPLHHVY